jgi:hypothetical protein
MSHRYDLSKVFGVYVKQHIKRVKLRLKTLIHLREFGKKLSSDVANTVGKKLMSSVWKKIFEIGYNGVYATLKTKVNILYNII